MFWLPHESQRHQSLHDRLIRSHRLYIHMALLKPACLRIVAAEKSVLDLTYAHDQTNARRRGLLDQHFRGG